MPDIFRVYRDFYEGTPYSLVKDEVAAGPFNSPRRIATGLAEDKHTTAAWERPISIFRTDHTVLNSLRQNSHGTVWIGPHIAHTTVFGPAWTSVATTVSRRFVVDQTKDVDRESLFYAVSGVGNWAHGSMFNRAIVDIRHAQSGWEGRADALERSLKNEKSLSVHNEQLLSFADEVHTAWWDLFWSLMFKYSDGYVVTRNEEGTPVPEAVGCPSWYLDAVNFDEALGDADVAAWKAMSVRFDKAAKQYAEIVAHRKSPAEVLV